MRSVLPMFWVASHRREIAYTHSCGQELRKRLSNDEKVHSSRRHVVQTAAKDEGLVYNLFVALARRAPSQVQYVRMHDEVDDEAVEVVVHMIPHSLVPELSLFDSTVDCPDSSQRCRHA